MCVITGSSSEQISNFMLWVRETFFCVPYGIVNFLTFAFCFIALMFLLGLFRR